jgi:hypothetical protein
LPGIFHNILNQIFDTPNNINFIYFDYEARMNLLGALDEYIDGDGTNLREIPNPALRRMINDEYYFKDFSEKFL